MRLAFYMLLILCISTMAGASAAEDPGETAFISKNRCVIGQILNLVRDTPLPPEKEQNRYLILYPTGRPDEYAQCAYDGARAAYCEIASPFYQSKGARVARPTALARLGYSVDASKGNYAKSLKLDVEGAPPLAEFILRSLYAAFLDDPGNRLKFQAPLVKVSPSPNACMPSS